LVLELKRSLVNENTCSEVLLCRGLVLAGCLLENLFHLGKVFAAGVLVAVDFVLELRLGG
jgi:hypothetical protein